MICCIQYFSGAMFLCLQVDSKKNKRHTEYKRRVRVSTLAQHEMGRNAETRTCRYGRNHPYPILVASSQIEIVFDRGLEHAYDVLPRSVRIFDEGELVALPPSF